MGSHPDIQTFQAEIANFGPILSRNSGVIHWKYSVTKLVEPPVKSDF